MSFTSAAKSFAVSRGAVAFGCILMAAVAAQAPTPADASTPSPADAVTFYVSQLHTALKSLVTQLPTELSTLRRQAHPEIATSESPFLGRPGQVVTYSDVYAALVKADLMPTLTENDIGLSRLLHTPGLSPSEQSEAAKWLRYDKSLQTKIAGLTGRTISRSSFVASLDATFREAGMPGNLVPVVADSGHVTLVASLPSVTQVTVSPTMAGYILIFSGDENDVSVRAVITVPALRCSPSRPRTALYGFDVGAELGGVLAGQSGAPPAQLQAICSGGTPTYSASAGLGPGQTIHTRDHLILQIHATPTLTTTSVTDTTRHFQYTQHAPGMAVVTVNFGIAPILDPFAGGFSQLPPFSSFSVASPTVNGHPLTSWPVLWERALAYGRKTGAEIGPLRHDGFSCSFVGSH